jgi:hypothetical protein
MTNTEIYKAEYYRIRNLGFIKCTRPKNIDGGIGNTFEDYLGVRENNLKLPDFKDFEVKSQREMTSSYVTLFTKSASAPRSANRILKDAYGKPDPAFPKFNSLHTSIFAHRTNSVYGLYKMRLFVNFNEQKLCLEVYDNKDNLLSNVVYWDFETLEAASNKLRKLAVVTAEVKKVLGESYFYYNKASIYLGFTFEKFMNFLNEGHIMFDIRVGVYKSGKKMGKVHDHGSSFRIKREKIEDLYDIKLDLE